MRSILLFFLFCLMAAMPCWSQESVFGEKDGFLNPLLKREWLAFTNADGEPVRPAEQDPLWRALNDSLKATAEGKMLLCVTFISGEAEGSPVRFDYMESQRGYLLTVRKDSAENAYRRFGSLAVAIHQLAVDEKERAIRDKVVRGDLDLAKGIEEGLAIDHSILREVSEFDGKQWKGWCEKNKVEYRTLVNEPAALPEWKESTDGKAVAAQWARYLSAK